MTREHWLTPERDERRAGGCWVYRAFDDMGELLYVGTAKNLVNRIQEHFLRGTAAPWLRVEATRLTAYWYPRRLLAEFAETLAIAFEQPVHNSDQAVGRAAAELFGKMPVGDRERRRRERIALRLRVDPGAWACAMHALEGTPWADLADEVTLRTSCYCTGGELRYWATEFGTEVVADGIRVVA